MNWGILKVLRKPYLFILSSNAQMTPLGSSHFSSHFLLNIGHNCFSSRIALPSHHFHNQTFFPALTDVLIPLSPKSIYPFPYCLQPGRQVVPYPCGEGWVRLNVSTWSPSPVSGCCPIPPATSSFTQQRGISLPSRSSPALCLPSVLRWVVSVAVLHYSKPCQ